LLQNPGRIFQIVAFYDKLCDTLVLEEAWEWIRKKRKSHGIDMVTVEAFDKNRHRNLEHLRNDLVDRKYIPDASIEITIPKEKGVRKLNISTLRDQIVQYSMKIILEPVFNPLFLDCSYGFRTRKGPVKAIRCLCHYGRQGYEWITKGDIDNFFDSIDRAILIRKIAEKIDEEEILNLIGLFLESGRVKGYRWMEPEVGIPQGSPLSPLLSNIYLHDFDINMVHGGYKIIRYADNVICCSSSREVAERAYHDIISLLEEMKLRLNPESEPIASFNEGFTFMGFYLRGNRKTISKEKFSKMQDFIRKVTDFRSQSELDYIIEELNDKSVGWRRYYGIGDTEKQFIQLQTIILDRLAVFVVVTMQKYSRQKILEKLRSLQFLVAFNMSERKKAFNTVLDRWDRKQSMDALDFDEKVDWIRTAAKRASAKKRRTFEDSLPTARNVIISEPGTFLGKSSGQLYIRKRDRTVKKIPLMPVKNVTIISKGVSLSSDLVWHCAHEEIPIDFIDSRGKPFARIFSPVQTISTIRREQFNAYNDERGTSLVKEFVIGKMKNQAALLKYFCKYRKKTEPALYETISRYIERIGEIQKKVDNADDTTIDTLRKSVMGLEGTASSIYWNCVKMLVPEYVDFKSREHRGSKNLFNMMLNYGYGILYPRVWSALVLSGLEPGYGFLHTAHGSKPALSFDLIEEFRQPLVDRPLIGLLNKNIHCSTDEGGFLAIETRVTIAESIMKRLSSRVLYQKKRLRYEDVIKHQARTLGAFLIGEKKRYRSFVAPW
jgi:group II intron reverse transcriptase/maturase/CRISPR-associated endonuclease Cas1